MRSADAPDVDLIDLLRRKFPEMDDDYQREMLAWGDGVLGPYLIVAFVFRPLLINELAKGRDTDFLDRFSSVVEMICESEQTEALNIIWLKLFIPIIQSRDHVGLLLKLLGPLGREKFSEAIDSRSREPYAHGKHI